MEQTEIDTVARAHSQILQTGAWGRVKGAFGWEELCVTDGSSSSAMILKRRLPIVNKCFFYVPRGPLADYRERNSLTPLLRKIRAMAKEHGALFLRMDPEVDENDAVSLGNLRAEGFVKAKKEIQPRSTFILDLEPGLESIKAGFESKFRYNIHVAEKHGISVALRTDEAAVDEFYGIYSETCSRQNFIIHPLSYYRKIRSEIIEKGLGAVFTAYHGTKAVASVIVFCFGRRVWYMYGASLSSHRNLMPNNLLHWEIIKWAKASGYKEYDLWGIPSNPRPEHPLWGVYRFKKGFNAKLRRFIGSYDLPFNRALYGIFDRGIIMYQNAARLIKKGTMSDSLAE